MAPRPIFTGGRQKTFGNPGPQGPALYPGQVAQVVEGKITVGHDQG
ncbi:hypothetical protein Rumeso_04396 [Rubellimicrobium mesophilum DSM 19309]|uniref:Uncharacterized protein n=1 Tax=Rubellimicrobium mesophilum DSM 19309 TaxID=442562 RepID=A0A017HI81_9RHOB|nr:hypothetical protein Rumeso_04396 [Rubellimicrobium mesophilum DSM 19309]